MARNPRSERLGSPRARLFVALEVPEDARERLASWRDDLLRERPDLRAVAPESLHLTLVFLGYRPEKEIEAIAAAVHDAVRELPSATLRATGVVAVPPRRPRLFALDLDDEGGRAVATQAALSDALAAARFYKPEKRPFWPHVTLARVKRGERAEPLEATPPPEPFEAADIVLYRSHLSPRGATYEALARMRLRDH